MADISSSTCTSVLLIRIRFLHFRHPMFSKAREHELPQSWWQTISVIVKFACICIEVHGYDIFSRKQTDANECSRSSGPSRFLLSGPVIQIFSNNSLRTVDDLPTIMNRNVPSKSPFATSVYITSSPPRPPSWRIKDATNGRYLLIHDHVSNLNMHSNSLFGPWDAFNSARRRATLVRGR